MQYKNRRKLEASLGVGKQKKFFLFGKISWSWLTSPGFPGFLNCSMLYQY